MIIWLKLLTVSEKSSHNFLISKVILSDPSHWIVLTKTPPGKGTCAVLWICEKPKLIQDLVGPTIFGDLKAILQRFQK